VSGFTGVELATFGTVDIQVGKDVLNRHSQGGRDDDLVGRRREVSE
jgi:hypothetical protein